MSVLHSTCNVPSLKLRPGILACETGLRRLPGQNRVLTSSGRRMTMPVTAAATRSVHGELQKGIAELYDESSGMWEDIWGDHMHHGYYDSNSTSSVSDHRSAQIRMIEEALRFAGVSGSVHLSLLLFSLPLASNLRMCLDSLFSWLQIFEYQKNS